VTSSTGAPYTLYLDLPPRHVVKVEVEGQGGKEGSGDAREGEVAAHVDGATREGKRLEAAYPAPADNEPTRGRTASLSPPASPTPARKAASDVTRGPDAPGSPTHPHAAVAEDTSPPPPAAKDDRNDADNSHHISPLAARLGHMFCPCTGFAYNSLTGERNVFVSAGSPCGIPANTRSASTSSPSSSCTSWAAASRLKSRSRPSRASLALLGEREHPSGLSAIWAERVRRVGLARLRRPQSSIPSGVCLIFFSKPP
jgi:hypothetical protein